MNSYPITVKETLSSLISEIAENPMLYVKNPGKDFTRKRKLPLEEVMHLLISMGGNSISKELLDTGVGKRVFKENSQDQRVIP